MTTPNTPPKGGLVALGWTLVLVGAVGVAILAFGRLSRVRGA